MLWFRRLFIKNLDHQDLKILRVLQKNGRISNSELADLVGLSSSACHRRLQILEKGNIIDSYVALLSPKAVGIRNTVYVEIKLTRQFDEALESFERSVRLIPEVVECHLMSGTADYLLKVLAKDSDDFERIHRHYLSRLPYVSNVESSFALRQVFKTTAISI